MSRNGSSNGFCIVTACRTHHQNPKKSDPYSVLFRAIIPTTMDYRCLHARPQPNHRAFAANQCEQSMESAEQQPSGGRGGGARGRSGSGASTASSSLVASSSRRSSSSSRSRSSSTKGTGSSGGGGAGGLDSGGLGGGGEGSGQVATPTVTKSLSSVSSSASSGLQTLPSPSGLRTPRAHGHFTRPRRFSPIKMEASPSASPSASMMGAGLGTETGCGGRRRESSGVASGSLSRSPK